MEIKTSEGNYSVTGEGQGIYNTVGATAGILALLGSRIGNLLGGDTSSSTSSDYVTKDEMKMIQDLAAKDSEIAMLKSDQNSEVKMTEVYKQAHSEIAALRDKLESYKDEQVAINSAQGVVNAQVGANIAVAQNQIADINSTISGLTKTIIPITNVCPEPMKLYNSWTAPTTTTTTGA